MGTRGSSAPSSRASLETDDPMALICHKLRTPLTAAMGFIQLALRDARRSGSDARNLEMADEQVRRMAGLIDQLSMEAGNRTVRESASL